MPAELLKCHRALDRVIEKAYHHTNPNILEQKIFQMVGLITTAYVNDRKGG
jgi:hypothetical protein